jgi:hypothetical protein
VEHNQVIQNFNKYVKISSMSAFFFGGGLCFVLEEKKYSHLPFVIFCPVVFGGYNMFKKDINWNGLWRDLEKYKVTNKSCECHKEDHADKHCNTGIAKSIENSYPSKTGFDISSLELGDIVGMYYSPSTNKGMAFCQKASFDKNGKIIKTSPFEFNTHIGFVVAIKDGVPIILHNIGNETQGLRHATPATKLLSKNGTMIAWVAKDNEMKKGLYIEKFRKGIKNDLPGFKNLPPGFIK